MRKIMIYLLIVFLMVSLSCCMAETYTAKTGPFTIQVESNESVEFTPLEPYPEDNFNVYDVDMRMEYYPSRHIFDIEIHDYGHAIDVSDSTLMESIINYSPPWEEFYTSWDAIEAGSKPGFMGLIEKKGKTAKGLSVDPMCLAAFSPDGFGNRGSVIAIIALNAKEETFKEDKEVFEDLLKDIRISRES
jgi:hypothetical protein